MRSRTRWRRRRTPSTGPRPVHPGGSSRALGGRQPVDLEREVARGEEVAQVPDVRIARHPLLAPIRRMDAGVAPGDAPRGGVAASGRSEAHTSELQSLMRTSYAAVCLKKKTNKQPP